MNDTRPKIGRNPFAQPETLWRVEFRVPVTIVPLVEQAFEDISLATSSFEEDERAAAWNVQILLDHAPKEAAIRQRMKAIGLNGTIPQPRITRVEPEEWQIALERDFPPLRIGRFFVHGAHAKHLKPIHAISLQVEAGMAFGSGEHATTSLCLRAIEKLARRQQALRVLDMGCGSGILAIASAKRWLRARVLAVDVDPVAAEVAQENIEIGGVSCRAHAIAADGYNAAAVHQNAPYDLILSNILARPLTRMARPLAAHLAPGGMAVLSGLLTSQEAMVLAAHRAQGLRLRARLVQDGWSAMMISK